MEKNARIAVVHNFCFLKTLLSLIERHAHRCVRIVRPQRSYDCRLRGVLVIFHLLLRNRVADESPYAATISQAHVLAAGVSGIMLAVPAFGLSDYAEDMTEQVLHILFILCLAWILICSVYAVQIFCCVATISTWRTTCGAAGAHTDGRHAAPGHRICRSACPGTDSLHVQPHPPLAGRRGFAGFRRIGFSRSCSGGENHSFQLLAGIQIAITEPIRIDDVSLWTSMGRIEEITAAYVVVCIWNLQRLIVPLSYFIEIHFRTGLAPPPT